MDVSSTSVELTSSPSTTSSASPVTSKRYYSFVWNFFQKRSTNSAECDICHKCLKMSNSSTTGLKTHLRSVHGIDSTNYIQKGNILLDMSTQEVVARVVSEGFLTFNQLTGDTLRAIFSLAGFPLPSHPSTSRRYLLEQYSVSCEILKSVYKNSGENRYSLTLDESTTFRGRRYLNLNVHSSKSFNSLGMIRVDGHLPAEKCKALIENRLSLFGLSWTELCGITTDGAAVMVKLGRIVPAVSQLCILHAAHLAVKDVLYQNKISQPIVLELLSDPSVESEGGDQSESINDVVSPDQEETLNFEVAESQEEEEEEEVVIRHNVFASSTLGDSWQVIIEKIRETAKFFKTSPVRNEVFLQPEVLVELNKHYNLVLDCPGKWNSLKRMLKCFLKLKTPVRMAYASIGKTFPLSAEEIEKTESLVTALQAIEDLSMMIGEEKCNLLMADDIIKCTSDMLMDQMTEISHELRRKLIKRYEDRRNTPVIHLLRFLDDHMFFNNEKDLYGNTLVYNNTRDFADTLYSKLYGECVPSSNDTQGDPSGTTSHEDESQETPVSLKGYYQRMLSRKSCTPTNNVLGSFQSIFDDYRRNGVLPPQLHKLKVALESIRPSSIECERAFSVMNRFLPKERSSIEDNTLDASIFLNKFFRSQKPYKKNFN